MSESRRRFLLRGAGLIALVLSACTRKPETFLATDITGVDWGRDFHLIAHDGKPRSLADFRGKVVALYFGYTHCPDECPTTMAKMAEAVRELGRDGERVQGLFVTVDPRRDTPAALAQYVPSFYPSFIGLYGSDEAIARTAKDFKLFFSPLPPNVHGDYSVDHSDHMLIFDPAGRLRLLVRPDAAAGAIAHDMRLLLEQWRS